MAIDRKIAAGWHVCPEQTPPARYGRSHTQAGLRTFLHHPKCRRGNRAGSCGIL